jgi:hypothetical protein
MTIHTKIVFGRPRDGESSATAGTLAKKINDVCAAAATIISVASARKGSGIAVVIVYSDTPVVVYGESFVVQTIDGPAWTDPVGSNPTVIQKNTATVSRRFAGLMALYGIV